MAWIDVIDEEEASGELADVYDAITGKRGKVANIMKVQSLAPRAMQAHMDLYLSIMFDRSGMSRREREMIATVVSIENDCEYGKNHHGEALNAYWEDSAKVEAFKLDWRSVDLPERQVAMLEYAVALTNDPEEISEDDVLELREVGFGEEEILNIALATSYYNFVNRLALGLGVESTKDEMTGYKY